MKTFKKLFAFSAIFALLATLLPVNVAFGASYSSELDGAYEYAYDNGITTMDSIDNANMYGSLTRVAMAKMMSNYAIDVLGLEADTSMDCDFPDVSAALDAQYDMGVTNACQLGLMGVGVTNFDPYWLVDRAKFGTVLSRALYCDMYNGGNPYYADHLAKLQDEGIMNNISNPMMLEVRGYVMLMMQRADEDAATDGCSAEELLACITADDYDDCIAECSDVEDEEDTIELAWDLEVDLGNAPADGTSIPKVGTVSFGEFEFTADSEDVEVYGVDLVRGGLGSKSDIYRVWLEKDGVRVSGKQSLNSDETTTISVSPALDVKDGDTVALELVVQMSGSDAGAEHGFTITDVNSSAEDVNLKNVSTPELRTATYTVAAATFATGGTATTQRASDSDLELGRFTISHNGGGSERDATLKMIKFRQSGTADLDNLDNVGLYYNGDEISNDVDIDGKDIVFTLNEDLEPNRNYTVYLRADVTAVEFTAGDTYAFQIRNSEDLNIIESNNGFRLTNNVTGTPTLATYTVEGSDVMFVKDTELDMAQNVAPGTDEVVFMEWEIKVTEDIRLEDATFTLSQDVSAYVSKLTLKVWTQSSTWTPDGTTAVSFDGAFTITKDTTVKVMADIKSTATAGTVKFTNDLAIGRFAVAEYVSNQNTISTAIGTIPSATLTVKSSDLSVSRTDGLSDRNIVVWASDVLLFGGKFYTSSDVDVTVYSFEATGSNTNFNDKLTLNLYVDGEIKSTKTYRSGKATFSSLNIDVEKNEEVEIEIYGSLDQSIAASEALNLSVTNITATDENGTDVTVTPAVSSSVTTIAAGPVDLVKNSATASASLFAAGTEGVELGMFNIIAQDDTLELTDLYLENDAASAAADLGLRINEPKLTIDGTTYNGAIRDGYVVFEGMSEDILPAETKTVTITANISDVLNTGDVQSGHIKLDILDNVYASANAGTYNGVRIVSKSNGQTLTGTSQVTLPTAEIGSEHAIARGVAKIANKGTTASSTRVMEFSITAEENRTTLSGLDLTLAGFSGTALMQIYKNSTSSANLVYSGSVSNATTSINLDTAVEVAEGGETTFIVEVQGFSPVLVGTSLYQKRVFSITDYAYVDHFQNGDVTLSSVANYVNVGDLPLYEEYQP